MAHKMPVTILFTGATSLAGRRFFKRLVDHGHRVVPVSRAPIDGHETCTVDLSKKGAGGKLPDKQFDVLIHFASHVPTREAESTWDECAPMNVYGTIRLLKWAKARVKRVLLASSCAIYGAEKLYTPTDENHPLWPDSHYALSKYAQEQIVRSFCVAEGVPYAFMRLGNVYGPGIRLERAVVKFLKQIANGERVTLRNGQMAGLNLIHIEDIAEIGERILFEGFDAYNVSSSKHISLVEYIDTAMSVLGRQTEVVCEDAPNAVMSNWYSTRRLADRHGIQPRVPLEQGIQELAQSLGLGDAQ